MTATTSTGTPRKPATTKPTLVRIGMRIAGNEDGATAIEYALIAAFIGAAVAATVYSLGTATQNLYGSIAALF